MTAPRISVLACARERITALDTMLASLFATAADPASVEILLRCDHDDEPMIDYLRSWKWSNASVVIGPRLSGYASLPVFTNQLARLSHGDLLLVVNDDAVFETQGWDEMLRRAAGECGDLFLLGVDTRYNADHYPFPCVPRGLVDTLGFLFDERLVYTDIWLRDVLAALHQAIPVPEVVIRHAWQGMTSDQVHAQRLINGPEYAALYDRCVAEAVAKIERLL